MTHQHHTEALCAGVELIREKQLMLLPHLNFSFPIHILEPGTVEGTDGGTPAQLGKVLLALR